MDKNEREEKIELYGRGYDLLKAALAEVPQDAMKFKPEPTEWSVHEIIIHIADSESNAALRARKLIVEPGSVLMAYDQDAWANNLQYHEHNLDDALEVTRLARKTTYELCGGRPVDKYGVNQSFHWSVWGTPRTPMYAGGITTSFTITTWRCHCVFSYHCI